MRRKLLSWLLIAAMVLGLCPMAFAANSDFTIVDGVLTQYNGAGGDVVIPSGVTAIGENAFMNCWDVTSVTIPSGVTTIGGWAFCDCEGLTDVVIPSSVTTIDERAFSGCSALENITIPRSVEYIGNYAFESCGKINVTVPASVDYVGMGAFQGCSAMADADGFVIVQNILFGYFGPEADEFTVPNGVTDISVWAVPGRQMTKLTIPDSVTSIGACAFYACNQLLEVTIPASVVEIGDLAFGYQNMMTTLSGFTIKGYAGSAAETYASVNGLTFVPLAVTIPTSGVCGDDVQWNLSSDGVLTFSGTGPMYDEDTMIQKGLNVDWRSLNPVVTKVVVEEGITTMEAVLALNPDITSVALPSTLTHLADAAFKNDEALVDLTIPEDFTGFGSRAFQGCRGLAKDDFVIVNGYLFDYFGSSQNLTIPEGVKVIDTWAFSNCQYLETAVIPYGTEELRYLAFTAGDNLKNVTIPATVTAIGDSSYTAFFLCPDLTITGYAGSYAEMFAKANGIPFNVIPMTKIPAVAASCETAGNIEYWTDGTDYFTDDTAQVRISLDDTVIPATGHDWGEWVITKQPTETEEGERQRVCRNDSSHVETETIPKLQNPFNDVPSGLYYTAPILWAVQNGITNGTSAATFSPDNTCTRGQIVTFLWRAKGSPEPKSTENPFDDVDESMYYYKAVLWAVENGITNGISSTQFGPDNGCTRAQVVTFLWRAEGKPEPGSDANPFVDVPAGQYYTDAVLWAVEKGITNGISAAQFGPDNTCTRGQIATFLYRDLA